MAFYVPHSLICERTIVSVCFFHNHCGQILDQGTREVMMFCPWSCLRLTGTQLWTVWSNRLVLAGVGLRDTRYSFLPQLFRGFGFLPGLFGTHTYKRKPDLCWDVIVSIIAFSDSICICSWFSVGSFMNCHCFLSNEIAEQMLLLETGQFLICHEAPAIIST